MTATKTAKYRQTVGVRRNRVVTFEAIRLRGQKCEARFLLHSHPSGGEGVSPVQGEG